VGFGNATKKQHDAQENNWKKREYDSLVAFVAQRLAWRRTVRAVAGTLMDGEGAGQLWLD
jgi:hypothetical protein